MNEDTIITSRYVHPLLETELCVIRDVLLCCIRMQVGKNSETKFKNQQPWNVLYLEYLQSNTYMIVLQLSWKILDNFYIGL